jgi:hypothetical protein
MNTKWNGMRAVLFTVLAGMVAAAPARGQAQDEAALATLRASMSATAYASLTATLRDAQQRGLPTQPLVAKALEGAAKNIPGDRIVVAVRQTSDGLAQAQALLHARGALTTEAEVTAVATARQRGVPADAIGRLAAGAGGRGSVGMSAHVLADVMERGVPLAVGVEVLAAWRSHGADPARLGEIPAAVDRLVRQGVVPARAGAAITAGLRLGRTPASILPADVPRLLGGG